MPIVTGNLTDITRMPMSQHRQPRIIFRLNKPNTVGGKLFTTDGIEVTPSADGSFSVDLAATQDMVDVGWYTVAVRWISEIDQAAQIDQPDWKISVPRDGGRINELAGVPENTRILWVGLSPPASPRKGLLWLEQDPTDAANTDAGRLYEWRGGAFGPAGGGAFVYMADLKGPPGYNALGTMPQQETVAAWVAGSAGSNPLSAAVAQAVADSVPVVDVHHLGARGDGVADDTAALQAAFNLALSRGGVNVHLRAGKTYRVTDELHIYRNTTWDGNGGRVLRNHNGYLLMNGDRGVPQALYGGHGNLVLRNLILDHNGDQFPGVGSTFTMGHADQVQFDRVTFLDATSHAVDCNASRGVRFRDCSFYGYANPDGNTYVEAIQIDYATAGGFPAFGEYDGTACRDILVNGCRFGPSENLPAHPRGVGSHGADPASMSEGITITENTFTDMGNLCVRPYGWNDVDIARNYAAGSAGFVLANTVAGGTSWGVRVTQNTAITRGATGIRFFGSAGNTWQNCVISQNRLYGGDTGNFHGIQVSYFRGMVVSENQVRNFMGHGIYCGESDTDVDLLLSGNSCHAIGYNGFALSGITDLRVVNNETWAIGRAAASTYAHVRLTSNVNNATVSGNQARAASGYTALHGFYAASSCSGVARIGNNWRGSATNVVADSSTSGTSAAELV